MHHRMILNVLEKIGLIDHKNIFILILALRFQNSGGPGIFHEGARFFGFSPFMGAALLDHFQNLEFAFQ